MKREDQISISPQRTQYPWSFLLVEEKPGVEFELTYTLHVSEVHRIKALETISCQMFASWARHGFDLLTVRRQALHAVCERRLNER